MAFSDVSLRKHVEENCLLSSPSSLCAVIFEDKRVRDICRVQACRATRKALREAPAMFLVSMIQRPGRAIDSRIGRS